MLTNQALGFAAVWNRDSGLNSDKKEHLLYRANIQCCSLKIDVFCHIQLKSIHLCVSFTRNGRHMCQGALASRAEILPRFQCLNSLTI